MTYVSDLVEAARLRRDVWALGRHTDASAQLVGGALRDARAGRLSPDEESWVERIEALRQSLLACDRDITKTDYGAGSRRAHRSDGEAYDGVVSATTVARACRASKPRMWALFLFGLVRRLRPRRCVELGACLGISAAYQAAAQRLNGGGSLVTLEGDEALAALAAENLQTLGLDEVRLVTGRFQDTLDGVLEEFGPVDYAFIDGHHDGAATVSYFDRIRPHLARPAWLVFDDILWPGMRPAWDAIATSDEVRVAIPLGNIGVCRVG